MQVESSAGERFELERPFNRGGEAEIWSVSREPHLVAKLYHTPTREHEAKLATMVASAPRQSATHPAVAWPLHLLYSKRNFVGYLMPHVSESRPIFHFYNPARRQRLVAGYPWRYFLHRTAQNLATAVELVHDRGHVVGDLNESNVLVNRAALVTLVDSDSFQVQGNVVDNSILTHLLGKRLLGRQLPMRTYRSLVGKAEFTAPELQGVDFKTIDRSPMHDNFALAVMIFYLLMEGYHPFAGVLSESASQQVAPDRSVGRVDLYGIRHGLFPHTRNSPILPPPRAPKLMWLDPEVQRAFYRAFVEGYQDPSMRPSAKEWRQLLVTAEDSLTTCPAPEQHVYSQHLRRCPHCEHAGVPIKPIGAAPTADANPVSAPAVGLTSILLWIWVTLAGRLPSSWLPYVSQLQRAAAWGGAQINLLWLRALQQRVTIARLIRTLPDQVHIAREEIHRHRQLALDWSLAHLIGIPAGALFALGLFHLARYLVEQAGWLAGPVWPAPLLLSAVVALLAAIFGTGQAWLLQRNIPHLPSGWSSRLAVWGGLAAAWGGGMGYWVEHQLANAEIDSISALLTNVMRTSPVWGTVYQWAPFYWQLIGVACAGGALWGWAQSWLLRQQFTRAQDSRVWTVMHVLALVFVTGGGLAGLRWGSAWTPINWAIGNWSLAGWFSAESGLWLGLWLGGSLGLLCAVLLTNLALLWFVSGTYRASHVGHWHIHWSGPIYRLPVHMWGWLMTALKRWGRAALLCLVIVLALEVMLAWVGG